MRYIAGVDIGAVSTKAVLIDEQGNAKAHALVRSGSDLNRAGERALHEALAAAGLGERDLEYIAATGYGRYQFAKRDIQITEITCHAKGACALFPGTRTVIDVGAQNTRAIAVDEAGRVLKFKMSERCAAGAGRFLERVAKALELDVSQLEAAAANAKEAQPISSICAVLAESEIINLVTEGRPIEDIVMGANHSIADRVVALARQVGGNPPVAVTGGVAKNGGTVAALSSRLGLPIQTSGDSTFAGALGAALLGRVRLDRRRKAEAGKPADLAARPAGGPAAGPAGAPAAGHGPGVAA